MKIIKSLSWFIVMLCGLIPLLLYGLLATTTGSAWVLQQALQWSGQAITVGTVSGDLLGDISLHQVKLQHANTELDIDQVTLSWQPLELFEQRITINTIAVTGLRVSISEVTDEQTGVTTTPPLQLPDITMPWPITIGTLTATDSQINTSEQVFALAQAQLGASLTGSRLALSKVQLRHEYAELAVEMQLDLQQSYPIELNFTLTPASTVMTHVPQGQLRGTISGTISGKISGTLADNLSGESSAIELVAAISLDDYATAATTVKATLTDIPSMSNWQTEVTVSNLPMTIAEPWLANTPAMMLTKGTVNARITANADEIMLSDIHISELGDSGAGSLQLGGHVVNYMRYQHQPEQVQFKLNLTAADLPLPEQNKQSSLGTLNAADVAISGSLDLYSVALGSHWTLMSNDDVSLSMAGIGTQNSLALSEIELAHATFDAVLTAQLGWLGSPWAAVNITEFDGQLELFEQRYDLMLSGGFGFINGAISANQVAATVNGTELTAHGALSPNSTLAVNLTVPQLNNWVDSPHAEAELAVTAGITGDYLKQLAISIDALKLVSEPFGTWQTAQSSQLAVSLDTFNIAGTAVCLHEQRDRNPASVCVDTELTSQAFVVNLDAKQLPLRLLNRLRENDVAERIWGNVDANADITIARTDGSIQSLSGVFRSDNTAITSLDDNLTSRLREWEVRWDGNLEQITATVQAFVEDDMGQILGDMTLTDVLSAQQLAGSLDLAINDLTLLQWILPDLRYVGASAIANIGIAGSLAQPTFSGAIELIADEIGFAQSGLLLTQVRVALEDTLDQAGLLSLQGQARSGGGWISLDGSIDLAKRELSLDIDGDTFRAVELAMAKVDVSPDLNIKVANQRIDITGTVTVPYAQINEPDLTSTATVSKDVRLFVNGEPVSEDDDSLYPIYANIRVILSDNVAINAYGFEGNVSGSIRLLEEPNRALRATGSIQVAKGSYEIYGQELEIQRGVLIYNGGAIDNPGLDLRVVRSAASMTAASSDQISVGAQVGGTLLAPDFRLFSSPTMQDAEILSYLVLGRPPGGGGSNNLQLQALLLLGSQGTDLIGKRLQESFGLDEFGIDSTADPLDTSFYIGKYLSPKLYVKYGVGLFENTNTFYIRYLLTDKLIIESTTSTEAQGGDILYTIEK